MKKLLSLLSVLAISGTAVPTVIAASPYQKEETIKNSGINYQKTNNLEKLNRNKRANRYDYDAAKGMADYYSKTITKEEREKAQEVVKKIAVGAACGGIGTVVGVPAGGAILGGVCSAVS